MSSVYAEKMQNTPEFFLVRPIWIPEFFLFFTAMNQNWLQESILGWL